MYKRQLSRAELSDDNGNVKNIHYGDILIKFSECLYADERNNIPSVSYTHLGINEACEILSLAKPTVYALVQANKIPYYQPGKMLKFKRTELMELSLIHIFSMGIPSEIKNVPKECLL